MFENKYDQKQPGGYMSNRTEKVQTSSGTYEVTKDAFGNEISRRLLWNWEK